MSTIFVTPRFGRGSGGLGVSAERIVRALSAIDDVHVVELADDLPALTWETLENRTRVSSVGERRLVNQLVSDRILALATPGVRLLGFYAADLAYTLHLTARLLGRPYTLFARGNDIDLEPFGDAGPRIFAAIAGAERVFCVSRELEHKIRAWVPHASTVFVANGVDPSAFPLVERTAGERIAVGIFGDLKAKKGLELLLANLDLSRFSLRIVGALRAEGEKLLHGYATLFPERAAFVEHVPFVDDGSTLAAEYAKVDVVCVPSTHEGMSNVLLEAMSSGRVCVASRVGGTIDVVTDRVDGILFPPGDALALRAALDRAADEARRGTMGYAARATIEARYSSTIEASAYAAIFSSS